MKPIIWLVATLLIAIAPQTLASAQTFTKKEAKELINTPVYNPVTKSYFELVVIGPGYSIRGNAPEAHWSIAYKLAKSRRFHGVRGRLAVIKDAKTNAFLRDTFHLRRKAWFGLRYWCSVRKLQWVTREFHTRRDYNNWDNPWDESANGCNSSTAPYLAAAYLPFKDGFRWFVHTTVKEYTRMFVEYQTGKE